MNTNVADVRRLDIPVIHGARRREAEYYEYHHDAGSHLRLRYRPEGQAVGGHGKYIGRTGHPHGGRATPGPAGIGTPRLRVLVLRNGKLRFQDAG